MRPKSLLLLALALGCGLVASIGISQVMDRNSRPQQTLETTPIYVALHNINTGDPIDSGMLALEEWPTDRVPRGAISTLEDLEGRRPRSTIIEGEPILDAKLLERGHVPDPIQQISKNMRLKTISVNAETSAAGLLGPGDRVDVHLFVKADARNNIPYALSKVILQNVRVFAVDATVQRSSDGSEERTNAKTISLMVTPQQASILTLAEKLGDISLVPRNPDDDSSANVAAFTTADLLDSQSAGNREFEQGRDAQTAAAPVDHGGLASVVESAGPPADPPFEIEIIEANAVRLVLIDANTGKPIRNLSPTPAVGPMVRSSAGETGAVNSAAPDANPEQMIDDFPIDFDN